MGGNTSRGEFEYNDDIHIDPEAEKVINIAMSLKYPIDIEALKVSFSSSILIKNPKFCSVMVRDQNGGKQWKRTDFNINDHIIIHHHLPPTTTTNTACLEDYKEAAVNAFLANIAASISLADENKPLWKLHVLMDLNCVVLRVHHALGDVYSLMSMLSACFGRKGDTDFKNTSYRDEDLSMENIHGNRDWRKKGVWGLLKSILLTFVYVVRFIGRVLWTKDDLSVINGTHNQVKVVCPKKLVTAEFKLEDFCYVKTAIPNTTTNDVLLGVLSCGLSKYLNLNSPTGMTKEQHHRLTAIIQVNLRKDPTVLQGFADMIELRSGSSTQGSSREDKTSMVLLPIDCCKRMHPLEHVTVMKTIMNKKKRSYEANCIHIALQVIASCFGPKVADQVCQKALSNSTLLISNIKGPAEEIVIADNPVTCIRGHISSQPQAGITINVVSYAGRVDLQVMVAKDMIPNPELLIKCFQESLLEMKSYSKLIHLLLSTGNPTYNSPDWFLYV